MVHLEAEVEIVLPQTDRFSLLFSQSFLILPFGLPSPLPLKDVVQFRRNLDPNTRHVCPIPKFSTKIFHLLPPLPPEVD